MGIITKGMGAVIKKIKPNVPKTEYDKAFRDLKIAVHKAKVKKQKQIKLFLNLKIQNLEAKNLLLILLRKKL